MKKAFIQVSAALLIALITSCVATKKGVPDAMPDRAAMPKIAVYVTGGRTPDDNKALSARLTHALVSSGKYNTIERSDAFLDQVAREMITQMSGAVDDEQISRLGQQAGADFVCIGEILEAFGAHQISARIVNVVSVEVAASGLASGQLKTMADLAALSDRAVALLLGVAQNTAPISNGAEAAHTGQTTAADKPAQAAGGANFRTVKIGDLTWMAENLNINTENSWCYGDAEFNCKKYGRLYTWNAATKACPTGWHLPNNAEWNNLMEAAGGERKVNEDTDVPYYEATGKKLKSKNGWNKTPDASGNGTDDYGFSALPGGYRNSAGSFGQTGEIGYFWSASENGTDDAFDWQMYHDNASASVYDHDKGYGFSVRCVGDE